MIVAITVINVAGFAANNLATLWGYDLPGLSGYEDAVTVLVGVAGLAMFPYCQMQHGHTAVDFFIEFAPPTVRDFSYWVSKVLTILIAIGLAISLTYGTIQTWSDGIETAVLGWPVWIFMPSAVFSCLLWAFAAMIESRQGQCTEKKDIGGS